MGAGSAGRAAGAGVGAATGWGAETPAGSSAGLVATAGADSEAEVGRSQVFGTTPDGAFQFNGYIFPLAGTYTVQVYDVTNPLNEIAIADPATVVVS